MTKILGEPDFNDVEQGDIYLYKDFWDDFNPEPVRQQKNQTIKKITFVTTGILKFDGGQTSMLHLGTELASIGYEIYYLSYKPQSEQSMEANAKINYPDYKGICLDKDHLSTHQSDIWIATLWESAYVIKGLRGYKMYFVQDYEPYFYPFGDQSILAQKTYELGLHMICLGEWCRMKIKEHCRPSGPLDVITFPCDNSNYVFQSRDFENYAQAKEIKLAVYTKWISPRRAPIVMQLLCKNLIHQFALSHKLLKIFYFGSDKKYKFINGVNLGKLNQKQLNDLYHRVDFGMVPSMTNMSLIPYEMMSTGLPVIDFEEGSGRSFLKDSEVIRTRLNSKLLFKTMINYMNNPQLLKEMIESAYRSLKTLRWSNTANELANIIRSLTVFSGSGKIESIN